MCAKLLFRGLHNYKKLKVFLLSGRGLCSRGRAALLSGARGLAFWERALFGLISVSV